MGLKNSKLKKKMKSQSSTDINADSLNGNKREVIERETSQFVHIDYEQPVKKPVEQ